MNMTNWTSKEFIRHLIAHSGLNQSEIGLKVFAETGQDYSAGTFSNKVVKDNLKLKEVQAACKLLGYRLILEKIEEK